MITAIHIENFKGIGERFKLPLRPITLLFGGNSAGKSTLLQAIHYVREILVNRNLDVHRPDSGGEFIDLGGFKNFVRDHDVRRSVTIRVDAELSDGEELFEVGSHEVAQSPLDERIGWIGSEVRTLWLELTVGWSDAIKDVFVSRYAVGINGQPMGSIRCAEPFRENSVWRAPDEPSEIPEVVLEEVNRNHPLLKTADPDSRSLLNEVWWSEGETGEFPNRIDLVMGDALPRASLGYLVTEDPFKKRMRRLLSLLILAPGEHISRALERFRYLGPLRATPPRNYAAPSPQEIERRWPNGLGAWDRLIHHSDGWILEQVNQWLMRSDRLDSGYRIRVQDFVELDISRIPPDLFAKDLEKRIAAILELAPNARRREALLVKNGSQVELRAADLGVGISQILPVLVTALDGLAGSLVAMEQPELHLHPRLQCEVGDMLIAGALGPARKTMIVETHSEHLILRILRRIRETARGSAPEELRVTPQDVSICYVHQRDGQSMPETIFVDEHGEFVQPWPDGFFEQDFYERFS